MKKNLIFELMITNPRESGTFTEKILLKAVELFAQKGYMNTLTSEIVQRARVAEGTIFRHYKTKEKLLLVILVPIVQNALP